MIIPFTDISNSFKIYKITNIVNKKVYIGQTSKSIKKRWSEHKANAGKDETYFHHAIAKYGSDNFTIEEIDSCDTKYEADKLEAFWISFFNSNDRKYGYNRTAGGGGAIGFKHSEESKRQRSEFRKSSDNNLRVAVLQFDLQMNFIQEWSSIKYAAEAVNIPDTNITRVCRGRRKTAAGFIWKYKQAERLAA